MSNHVYSGRDGLYTLMFCHTGESEETLKSVYSQYGEIARAKIVGNLVFLSFYKEAEAQRCLKENPFMKVPDPKEKKGFQNGLKKSPRNSNDSQINGSHHCFPSGLGESKPPPLISRKSMEISEATLKVTLDSDRTSPPPPPLVKRCCNERKPVDMIIGNFPKEMTENDILDLIYQLEPSFVGDIHWTTTAPFMPFVHVHVNSKEADILESWNHLLYRGHRLIVARAQKLIEEGSALV